MNNQTLRMRRVGRLALPLTLTLLLLAGSIAPVQANPGVIYVAPGAACGAGVTPCYGSIQAAVDAAVSGDTIKVAAGTYTGVHSRPAPPGYSGSTSVTQMVYVNKSVTIQGGYMTGFADPPDPEANPATLNAQGQGRVLFITGDIDATIEGLRITGGATETGGHSGLESVKGGGVYISLATAVVTSNRIFGNTAEWYGGGLYLRYSDSTVSNNTFSSNIALYGGGLFLSGCNATLSDNVVTSNAATHSGGGAFLYPSSDTLNRNTIVLNTAAYYAGGVLVDAPSEGAALNGNTIMSNTADYGGGLYLGRGVTTLSNNIITDNEAGTSGSGVYVHASSHSLLHNTIARNTGGDGSGVYVTEYWDGTPSTAALTNNILTNQSVGIRVEDGNTATVNGVLWFGNTANTGGLGTINVSNEHTGDPAFAADGYHLMVNSAAIDRGVDADVASDIDGDLRPMGHGYDLGADEFRVALKVTKHADPDLVGPGEQLTYTISVVNTGDVGLNAIITDTLPTHVTADGTVFLPGGGIGITWTANITAPGGAWMETVVVTVAKGYEGPLTNLVEVTTDEGATGKAVAIVNAYRIYLPLVMR